MNADAGAAQQDSGFDWLHPSTRLMLPAETTAGAVFHIKKHRVIIPLTKDGLRQLKAGEKFLGNMRKVYPAREWLGHFIH